MPYEYHVVRASNSGALEVELNKLAKEGFRASHLVVYDPGGHVSPMDVFHALMEREVEEESKGLTVREMRQRAGLEQS